MEARRAGGRANFASLTISPHCPPRSLTCRPLHGTIAKDSRQTLFLWAAPVQEENLVRNYMISPVTAAPDTTSLLDAVLLMRRSGIRHLPVVDGERLVGIITDRDLNRLAPSMLGKPSPREYNEVFENTPLSKVMIRNPITVTPDSRILDAVAILHHKKLGCLPVVENGRLVGIITVTDMLGLLLRMLGGAVAAEIELGEA